MWQETSENHCILGGFRREKKVVKKLKKGVDKWGCRWYSI